MAGAAFLARRRVMRAAAAVLGSSILSPVTGGLAAAAESLRPWRGDAPPAPPRLPDLAGEMRDVAEWRGRPLLLHFFATWCAPCRPEIESLNRLALAVGNGAPAILSVSVAEPELRVRRFFDAGPARFPVLLDTDRGASRAWRVDSLPTTFLLDSELRPRLVVETDLAWDEIGAGRLLGRLAEPGRNAPT